MFQFLGLLVIGLIIGVLARLLLPGRQRIGLVLTLILGVLGAIVGGALASLFGAGSIFELNFVGFVIAVLVAVGVLAVAETAGIGAPRGRDRLDPGGPRRH
jgi:uncharacterized membrane protein YeaQ/YmgE (transglycosylase-associated protein family)